MQNLIPLLGGDVGNWDCTLFHQIHCDVAKEDDAKLDSEFCDVEIKYSSILS
jgi:hypothetical protein